MSSAVISSLPDPLNRIHSWIRTQPWLGRFTLMNRLLLAMAFIPTGLVKATGQRFTQLPVDNPVGFFFEAMYQTGPFWYFIGLCQIVAAICLLIPATATLGAVLFLPIAFSMVLITWGIGFGGTVYVTAGMLLSVLYLICWDADKIWAAGSKIFSKQSGPKLLDDATVIEKSAWVTGGLVGIALLLTTRGFIPISFRLELFYLGVAAFLVVVGSWIRLVIKNSRQTDAPSARS